MAPPARPSCAVVGAGAAGLFSAAVLSERGWDVTIFEARDRIGGRCARATLGGRAVDLGAEFSHGRGAVFELCEAAGMAAPRAMYSHDEEAPPDARCRLSINAQLVDGNGRDTSATAAMRSLWDEIITDDSWSDGTRADCSFAQLASHLDPDARRALDAFAAVEYATSLEAIKSLIKSFHGQSFTLTPSVRPP